MQSQNRKRAPAWTKREVLDLIAVWGDESMLSELHSKRRNAKIFEKISEGMKDRGYNRDPQQCHVKLKELRQAYQRGKRPLQEDLDMLLGSDLCSEEQDFLQKRKKVVAATLKKVLQLEEDLLDHEDYRHLLDRRKREKEEWCEFSPYEVGFLKYAAFIRSEDFGSEFFTGRLMTKNPESWICYIEGPSGFPKSPIQVDSLQEAHGVEGDAECSKASHANS
ncbi:Cytosolic phospholipase A2 beta [Chelonia mydas]|uniref:Cytosolic phospholipase A2 beta n=1 Tax=Chelonia mydas TaxID=8469 RepID=M7C536_CHEMY|nr:Cytosolic phospholipase A2 beta [Chelonia mydas]